MAGHAFPSAELLLEKPIREPDDVIGPYEKDQSGQVVQEPPQVRPTFGK
jgi:hypothetical protein